MSTPPTPPPGGPYLQNALICEKMLREADGVQSFIRVVDRIMVGAVGTDPPAEMPPQTLDLTLAISLKGGDARGRHAIKIRPEMPSGEQMPALEIHLQIEGEERGNNVNINLNGIIFGSEGLWWFDVLFGDNEVLLTRVPLRLSYQPQRVLETGQTESQ